jgi:hypothetical protein
MAQPLPVLPSRIARGVRNLDSRAARCRRKFLRYFPAGFRDEEYLDWEREYKWLAHERWMEALDRASFREMLDTERYAEIAQRAVAIESRTNLLFSFEKMALRDAVKPPHGARAFAMGLYEFLMAAPASSRASSAGARPSPIYLDAKPACSPGRY